MTQLRQIIYKNTLLLNIFDLIQDNGIISSHLELKYTAVIMVSSIKI
jgi:hypothetical protein